MIIENKLDNSFGKSGTIAGFVLLIAGLFLIRTVSGVFLILLGSFFSFSHSGVSIDTEKRTIHIYSKIMGLFKSGGYKDLKNFDHISVIHNKRISRTFSQSNRITTLEEYDYRVFLISPNKRVKVAVKKCDTIEEATKEAKILSQVIEIPFVQ